MKNIGIGILICMLFLTGCGTATSTENVKDNSEKIMEENSNTTIDDEKENELKTEIEATIGTEALETVEYTFKELNLVMYAKSSVNVRSLPSSSGEQIGKLSKNQEVAVTGQCNETSWYRVVFNNQEAYVSNNYLVNKKVVAQTPQVNTNPFDDPNYEFYWHRNCITGTSYLNEPTEKHCFFVDYVHYEVTKEICDFMEEYRQQKFREFQDSYRGWYTDETRQELELHTLGALGVVVTVEEFEEIYSDWGFVIYDSYWDHLVEQQNFVDTATTEKLISMGYIQILPCAPGNECN